MSFLPSAIFLQVSVFVRWRLVPLAVKIPGMTPPLKLPELTLIPVIFVPVPALVPSVPVSVQVSVMYPVISGRQMAVIIRRHIHDEPRDMMRLDIGPASVVYGRPVPVTPMETVPEIIVKIKTRRIRHHIDISCSAGNHHNLRRLCKYQRGWKANRDVHICFHGKRHADKEQQGNHKVHDLFHRLRPPLLCPNILGISIIIDHHIQPENM
jgi:hypothetical protein